MVAGWLGAGSALAQGTVGPAVLAPTFAPPAVPPGMVQMTPAEPTSGYSFGAALANTHGYISTGVSSYGGAGVDGGVTLPLVPGRVSLEVGGGTGQMPIWSPGLGRNNVVAPYTEYHATLSARLTDNTEVSIGVAGANLRLPPP